MSSNLEIKKKCECCKKVFVAKTTTTRYCSHKCNSKAYKANKSKTKSSVLQKEHSIKSQALKSVEELQKQDFFSVAETAMLLGLSRQTIYNFIADNKLKASHVTNRVCIIRRSDIDSMCDDFNDAKYRAKPNKEQKPITEFYTVAEIKEKYDIKESWLYKIVRENNIPKTLMKGKSYFSKGHIDKYFEKKGGNAAKNITEWYSVENLREQYNLSSAAIYSFVSENNIPRKKEGRNVFYSKKHFDIAKGYQESEYYTTEEAKQKYKLTRESLYHYIKFHNIPKVKEGRYIKISKPDLDKIFELNITL